MSRRRRQLSGWGTEGTKIRQEENVGVVSNRYSAEASSDCSQLGRKGR